MDIQFKYIIKLAESYKALAKDNLKLYTAINQIEEPLLNQIYDDYGSKDLDFKPVNLLRAESARYLLEGKTLDSKVVEDIKDNIRKKNTDSFKHYPKEYRKQIEDYRIGKRDIFSNWQNPWSIFHTFFYRGLIKDTTQQYLKQISLSLKKDLQVHDYNIHWVDFNGPSNFGLDRCWLALYPEVKHSHRDAYQFFINFSEKPEAGRVSGHSVNTAKKNNIKQINSYADAVKTLKDQKEEILKLNQETRNYFKYAPGEQANKWEEFYSNGVAKISYSNLPVNNITDIKTREDLNIAAGFDEENQSNQLWNLWLFKSANIGDLVFANKGTNTCIGIGIIESSYQYDENSSDYRHYRKVNWITNKVYQYKRQTFQNYSTLFRPDTFSPTKVWQFILDEYARLYPELIPIYNQYSINISSKKIANKPFDDSIEDLDEDIEEEREINFWWLNANPTIWSISSKKEGEKQTYTARNEKGNKRRIYKHFEAVLPGDLMIGYESSPVKQVKAIYEITKALHHSEKEGEIIEFELLEKLEVPINWNELNSNPSLSNCEVFINNQGSLFKLTEEDFDIIREVIDNKNIVSEQLLENSNTKAYDYINDPDRPFIDTTEFKKTISILLRNKNIILQGPPGVGKTFIARKIAYDILRYENDAQISMVQFHQSYSYEDFIQGLRPSKNGFELKNGSFYTFCQKAHAHPDRKFFFIIDEINRGNMSKIFGELLMLIEADKRKSKFAIQLTYAEEETDTFYIPENIHIIGTMNTSDRSLAIVDYALRRRFSFINLSPNYGIKFHEYLQISGVSIELSKHISNSIQVVNKAITEDRNLGSGFEIGHSYFCTYNNNLDEKEWYNEVVDYEIKPLLEEIWFDSLDQAETMVNNLRLS